MLDQTQVQNEEAELWNEANNPPEKTYDLFGQLVDLQIFKGAYQSGTRGAVPFNPAVHQKSQTIVRFYIQPLAEIDVKYPDMLSYESPVWADWGKVTFPSIKAQGVADAREVANRFARFARVPNGKKYEKKDKATGQPTGEMGDEMTWKIVVFYASEDECRAAYVAAGGKSDSNGNGHNAPAQVSNEDAERTTAYKFLEVIVSNAVRGQTDWKVAKELVGKALEQYPTVTKFFTVDSTETAELMTKSNDKLLPF